ncbi:MAG: hypothetical protein SFW67_28640, partial [Myxococcaceae bacterium]|nr:hypothetical protein [Myxococcaceae bacterium]
LAPIIQGDAGTNSFTLTRLANVVTATWAGAGSITGMVKVGERVSILSPPTSFGQGPFVVTAVTATTFSYAETGINTGPSAATTVVFAGGVLTEATNETILNRIAYSKPNEFEAFPATQYLDIGASDSAIVAVASTRETLWVFKEDGLFRVTGDDDDTFDVERMDSTIVALNRECVVPFAESICAWTNKGVMLLSESSLDIISEPITQLLQQYVGDSLNAFAAGAFGLLSRAFMVADPIEGIIRLHLPGSSSRSNDSKDGAGEALVWCRETASWARWEYNIGGRPQCIPLMHGVFSPFDKRVYYCDGYDVGAGEGYFWRERLPNDAQTYSDDNYDAPLATRVKIERRVLFVLQDGKAPVLDKRWDEVTVLCESEGGVLFEPFTYAFASERDQWPNSFNPFGMIKPQGYLDTSATIEVPDAPTVRIAVPIDQARGGRLLVQFTQDVIDTNLEILELGVAYEVLTPYITR